MKKRKKNSFQLDREWVEPLYIGLLTVFGVASLFRGCGAKSAEVSEIKAKQQIEAAAPETDLAVADAGDATGTGVLLADSQNTDTPWLYLDAATEETDSAGGTSDGRDAEKGSSGDTVEEPIVDGFVADKSWDELSNGSESGEKSSGESQSGGSSSGEIQSGGNSSGGSTSGGSSSGDKAYGPKKSKKSKDSVKKNTFDPAKFGYVSDVSPNITYFDDDFEAIQGIDVSEHQGVIDWNAVADAGYKFVFVRVGFRGYGEEGTLNEDTLAINYLKGAEKAGLQVGAYFFSQAISEEEAAEEALFAAEIIKKSGVTLDLPLVYDPELVPGVEGRANKISRKQVCANMNAFAEAAEKAINCKVALYANLYWERYMLDADTLDKYEIWYADYQNVPETPYHFTWWQYSEHGTVPGIKGDMDLNLWIRRMD